MGRKRRNFEINTPTKWEDITLNKYIEFVKLYQENNNKPTLQQILSVLSDKDINYVNQIPTSIVEEIFNELTFLKDSPSNEVNNTIFVNGEEYRINYEEELKFGEFVDVQQLLKDDKNNYPLLLAILCRKPDEIYDDKFIAEKIKDRMEMFGNLPIPMVFPTITFFLSLSSLSKMTTVLSSEKVMEVADQYVQRIKSSRHLGLGKKLFLKSLEKQLKTLREQASSI